MILSQTRIQEPLSSHGYQFSPPHNRNYRPSELDFPCISTTFVRVMSKPHTLLLFPIPKTMKNIKNRITAGFIALTVSFSLAQTANASQGQEMVTFGDSITANGGAPGSRASTSPTSKSTPALMTNGTGHIKPPITSTTPSQITPATEPATGWTPT